MYVTTLEDIKHAADILRAMSEGKRLKGFAPGTQPEAQHVATICLGGGRYAVEQPPRTRPFTVEEADRLVGCVLVRPEDGLGGTVTKVRGDTKQVSCPWNSDPTLFQLHAERWHYRLPGSTEMKECWVTE